MHNRISLPKVLLGFALIPALIAGCRTGKKSDSATKQVEGDLTDERMLIKNVGPNADDWELKFFHCKRSGGNVGHFTNDCVFDKNQPSQTAILKWAIKSTNDRNSIDCNANLDWNTEKLDLSLKGSENDPSNHYYRSYASGNLKIQPEYFERCMKKNPATGKLEYWGQPEEGSDRKVNLQCLAEDFNGPKRVIACLYEDKNGTQGNLIHQGWGLADANAALSQFKVDAPTGLSLSTHGTEGFDASNIEDVDAVYNYAMVCGAKVGFMKAFDCTDEKYFKTIPVTKDGIPVEDITSPLDNRSDATAHYSKCDKPAYLGLGQDGQCTPHTRLGRIPMYLTPDPTETRVRQDVDAVVVCRRYNIVDKKDDGKFYPREKNIPHHEDIAVIAHNRDTGDTCYFQALSGFHGGKPLPTHRVSPPHELELPENDASLVSSITGDKAWNAQELWIKPTDSRNFACAKCHDSDPFMHSPHVDQVSFEYPTDKNHPLYREGVSGTDLMVPCDPAKPDQVQANKCKLPGKGKYSLVSKYNRPPYWPNIHSIEPTGDDEKACVKCHRIGSENTRKRWVADSLGDSAVMAEYRTNFSTSFPESHWMPYIFANDQPVYELSAHSAVDQAKWTSPVIHSESQRAEWDAKYAPSGDALTRCINNYGDYERARKAYENDPESESVKVEFEKATAKYTENCKTEKITEEAFATNQSVFEMGEFEPKTIGAAKRIINLSPVETATSGEVAYAELDLRLKHEKIHELIIDLVYAKSVSDTDVVSIRVFDGRNLTEYQKIKYELTDILDSKDFAWKYSPTVRNPEFARLTKELSGGRWRLEVQDTFTGFHKGKIEHARLTLTHD